MSKIKLYKNSARQQPENREHYVPQYKKMGIEPAEINFGAGTNSLDAKVLRQPSDLDNPRIKHPAFRQEINSIPNVGNNKDITWTNVDGSNIDCPDADPNYPMIDNNEFVDGDTTTTGLIINSGDTLQEKSFLTAEELQQEISENLQQVNEFEDGSYILFLNGTIISVGDPISIEQEATNLVFGDHELCENNQPFSLDDILVLKKMKIKHGIFVE